MSREDFKGIFMDWNLYCKIADEVGQHPGTIFNFGTDGEPFLHKRLLDMFRYARQQGVYPINIITNGTRLPDEVNRAICEENLVDLMNISIDSITPEGYLRVRGERFAFEQVVGNVERFIEIRNEVGSTVKVMVNIIDQIEVGGEAEKFKAFWEPKVDIVLTRNYTASIDHNLRLQGRPKEHFEPVERWPCMQPFRRFNISHEGVARFCVDDWYDHSRIGDLRTHSIAEIWNSEAYKELRQYHLERTFKHPYCNDCTKWQGMRWNYNYFTAMDKVLSPQVTSEGS
jgi:radical SAM protein with 4Fe4S-binding SPASM domain